MWSETGFSHLTNITYPIVQAPMANLTTPELVAAVSNAGALGSFGGGYCTPKELKKAIRRIRKLTSLPFSVNLFIPQPLTVSPERCENLTQVLSPIYNKLKVKKRKTQKIDVPSFMEQMEVVITERVPIFSFTFGMLDEAWIERLKENNTIIIGTATCKEEAKLLEQSGVDAICLQGAEAGGHRGTFIGREESFIEPLDTLISDCNGTIAKPLIAAGGIMDADDIKRALQLGASAVQMGTAFVTTKESGASEIYKTCLLLNPDCPTTLTRAFTGKLARALPNTFINFMEEHPFQIVEYPEHHYLTRELRASAEKQKQADFMSLWAGKNFSKCKNVTVKEFLEDLIEKM